MKNIVFRVIRVSWLVFVFSMYGELSPYEKNLIKMLQTSVPLPEVMVDALMSFPSAVGYENNVTSVLVMQPEKNILFQRYPALQRGISYVSLGDLPTPILHCGSLSREFDQVELFVKHDGVTGSSQSGVSRTFGGNKLRKLQYLLADAMAHGHDTVMTFGAVGSNHALQTTLCTNQHGLSSICMLVPQPNAAVVRRNLLLQQRYGAQLHYCSTSAVRGVMASALCYEHRQKTGKFPYIIPTGGSCALGVLGYVEAAFELKKQIEQGLMPIPDRLYVTLGSGGTAAGLLLGLKAADMPIKLYFVIEEPEKVAGEALKKVLKLCAEANELLCSCDSTFPQCTLIPQDYEVITDCCGEAYGLFTPECVEAIRCLRSHEGIFLDGTYTGKCFAAVLRDLRSGVCKGQAVLFWNTFCAENFDELLQAVDYHALPMALHGYFKEDLQELDRA